MGGWGSVGGDGWLDKLIIRLTLLPTFLKLKLSLSLETTFSLGVGDVVGVWLGIKLSNLQS